MRASGPISRRVAHEAAQWLMRLGAEDVSAADIRACDDWRATDAEHERAWQRAQRMNVKLGLIPARIGLPTLLHLNTASTADLRFDDEQRLPDLLPVRIRRHTEWWVIVEASDR